MKSKWTVVTLALLAVVLASDPALARRGGHFGGHHHHGGRIGIHLGLPLFWPGWYSPYDYGYPYYRSAPLIIESQPQQYIERGDSDAAMAESDDPYWYYCEKSRTYYPYVETCPGGWKKEIPRPPKD